MIARKIKENITHRIRHGHYGPGEKLPTRMELVTEFQAARGTIDKVMGELRAEGYLRSCRGDGTYVSSGSRKNQRHVFMVIPNAYFFDRSPVGPWPKFMEMHCWDSTHQRVGYVSTNTMEGLREMASWLLWKHGRRVDAGMLLPCFDLEKPYHIEREVFFTQVANELGLRISRIVRASDDSESSLNDAARRYFEPPVPKTLFLPDIIFQPLRDNDGKREGDVTWERSDRIGMRQERCSLWRCMHRGSFQYSLHGGY